MSDKPSGSTGKIAKSAGSVSIAVMCSRVLGLIREQIFAGLFGAGYAYDAFVVAFRIPNLLRDLFGEGALSAAFVTVFTDYDTTKGKHATLELAGNVLVCISILLSFITLAGIYFTNFIVSLLAPEFGQVAGKHQLTVAMTMIMFPFLIFVSLSAVVMGILNTKGKFFIPALSSSFFNLGSIVGGTALALIFQKIGKPAIAGMAWGTLIGGLLQLIVQLPTLRATGFRFLPRFQPRDPGIKRIALLMVPAIIGLSATQINIFINTYFASSCEQGSVSWLNYSFRLVQLPIGVFGVALSIAAMPVLANYAALKDFNGLQKTFSSSLIMVFSLTIPATAGLILLAHPIIGLIFEHGAFTPQDTIRTAEALRCYTYGLFAYSAVKITVPAFYALGKTRYPVIASFLAVALNIILITQLIDTLSYRAIPLSTSGVMMANFIFLAFVLVKKLPGFSLIPLGKATFKILTATVVMTGTLIPLTNFCAGLLFGGIAERLAGVFLLIGAGGVVYTIALYLLKVEEFESLTQKVVQKLRSS